MRLQGVERASLLIDFVLIIRGEFFFPFHARHQKEIVK